MKTKIIIIEDSMYKSFTTKQILESQLKLSVDVINFGCSVGMKKLAADLTCETIIIRHTDGVSELLDRLKKRNTNRRNTDVTLLLAEDFEDELVEKFHRYLATFPKTAQAA
jgi:hypothetical protein